MHAVSLPFTHAASPLLASLSALLLLTSCVGFTRTEKDRFTITDVDTVEIEQVHNQPNDRDNGVIYPSSRTIVKERHLVQEDSVEEREYPDFIRLGVFESVGLVGSYLSGNSLGRGVFGVYYDIDQLLHEQPRDTGLTGPFAGAIYRFGIGEWKMHWFGDDPNWSWGVTAFELIQPDDDPENTLRGIGVLTVHKRFYFRDKIPYLAISPQIHMSAFPSQYINAGASADVGSIGGLNLRLYAGYTFGLTAPVDGKFVSFPYAGLGMSVADFLNREEEMEVEWKYHEHSAWEIGLGDGILLGSNSDYSFFSADSALDIDNQPAMKGFSFRLLPATIAIPILDHRLALGTTLIQLMVLGGQEQTLSFLPIRASYFWQPLGNTRFTIEPFLEFNYLPSQYVHTGVRAALPLSDQLAVLAVLGYASGNTGSDVNYFQGTSGSNLEFSKVYLGFGASFLDKIFGKGDLRYGKGYPHE